MNVVNSPKHRTMFRMILGNSFLTFEYYIFAAAITTHSPIGLLYLLIVAALAWATYPDEKRRNSLSKREHAFAMGCGAFPLLSITMLVSGLQSTGEMMLQLGGAFLALAIIFYVLYYQEQKLEFENGEGNGDGFGNSQAADGSSAS